jgi:hypothetical protein
MDTYVPRNVKRTPFTTKHFFAPDVWCFRLHSSNCIPQSIPKYGVCSCSEAGVGGRGEFH